MLCCRPTKHTTGLSTESKEVMPSSSISSSHTDFMRASCRSSETFSNVVTPLTLLGLEQHDDELATIAQPDNAQDIPDTSYDITASTTTTSSATTINSVDRSDLHRIRLIGSGTFCHVHLKMKLKQKHIVKVKLLCYSPLFG